MDTIRPFLWWRAVAAAYAVATPLAVLRKEVSAVAGLVALAFLASVLGQRNERNGSVLERRFAIWRGRVDLKKIERLSVYRISTFPFYYRVLTLKDPNGHLSLWLIWWNWRPLIELVRPHVLGTEPDGHARWLVETEDENDDDVNSLFGY